MTHVINARELFNFARTVMETVAADPRAADSMKEEVGTPR